MSEREKKEFIVACKAFLSGFGIQTLRSYARNIGVQNPTKEKNKEELIASILAVLVGDIAPQAPSKRGAPVKNDFVDPKVVTGIEELRARFSSAKASVNTGGDVGDFEARLRNLRENKFVFTVEDPNPQELEENGVRTILKGQLETLNEVSMLLPLDCQTGDRIIMSSDMARAHDLRDGDVVTCYARKQNGFLLATQILTVNGLLYGSFERGNFQENTACYPRRRVDFFKDNSDASFSNKCLQWLVPLGRGDRGLVVGSLKTGKSLLLKEIARTSGALNNGLRVMTLLVDQSPERISQYRQFTDKDNLVYTTYEDDPERQVFVAEFILKRAKRYAECGMDVLLLVDSFNSLARAFNDTDASAGGKVFACGLESKTVQYLKRFLGTARCFEKGGSITILGVVATDTGNPADDLIKAELSAIGNMEVALSNELAKRRIYPALDILGIQGNKTSGFWQEREEQLDVYIRNEFIPKFGTERLLEVIENTPNFEAFEKALYHFGKDK